MFPNIDNNLRFSSVKKYLKLCSKNIPSTNCLLEALELCLWCNNSIFNNENYLQIDSTAQGPHMLCSYTDITMVDFDKEALEYHLNSTRWKRFGDDLFVLCLHGREFIILFPDYINKRDLQRKWNSPWTSELSNYLEFLDFKLKWKNDKITVDVYSKPTNSFTYVLPTTSYSTTNNLDEFVILMKNLNIEMKNIKLMTSKGLSSRISEKTIPESWNDV